MEPEISEKACSNYTQSKGMEGTGSVILGHHESSQECPSIISNSTLSGLVSEIQQ